MEPVPHFRWLLLYDPGVRGGQVAFCAPAIGCLVLKCPAAFAKGFQWNPDKPVRFGEQVRLFFCVESIELVRLARLFQLLDSGA